MKIKQYLLTTVAALSLAAIVCQPPQVVAASNIAVTASASESTVSPQSDIIKWIYYTAPDGKIYKRLYNASTATWIGDWIYVSG